MINFPVLVEYKNLLIKGTIVSFKIAIMSCLISMTFGALLGAIQLIGSKTLNFFVLSYMTIVDGTPKLIHLLIAMFLLPKLHISASPFWIVVIALGLGSVSSIAKKVKLNLSANIEQLEAAQTLGISSKKIIYRVLLPDAIKKLFPLSLDEFSTLFKNSSLGSVIGVSELMKSNNIMQNRSYDAPTALFATFTIYWSVTTILSIFTTWYKKRNKT